MFPSFRFLNGLVAILGICYLSKIRISRNSPVWFFNFSRVTDTRELQGAIFEPFRGPIDPLEVNDGSSFYEMIACKFHKPFVIHSPEIKSDKYILRISIYLPRVRLIFLAFELQ